jgi:DNA-binding CsgD family transcriptional regulator
MAVTTPLRGRDELLALIRKLLVGAAGGRGATLFVEGRPGLGKTRLLDEAAEMAAGLGIRVGRSVVPASDLRLPLGALFAALFDGVRPLVDPSERSRLHYLPEQQYWLLDELESLLERAALRSPLLICLDDMQWSGDGCQVMLRNLTARLASLPIVWLVAYRSGRESAVLRGTAEDLVRDGALKALLGPLDAAAIGQVVHDIVRAVPDDALLDLAQRAHGSPFLLVELLHGLRDEALVSIESGRARLVEARLPARVRDSMRERLGRMSEVAGRVAAVASVLGQTFSFDQLASMLDMAPAALLDPVEELLGAELFSQGEDALTFRHDLLREAVRDCLPASAQRALQRQAVTVLLAHGAAPVEVAAQLAATAVPGDGAAVRTLREAARTLADSDPSTAADLCRRALELASDADPVRGPLAAQTALLLHAAGRVGEGKAFADAVLGEVLPPEQEAEVRLSLAGMMALSPDVRAEAGRLALAIPGLPAALRARHVVSLVHNLWVAGCATETLELLPEAREVVAAIGDPTLAYALELTEGGIAYAAGDPETALGLIEKRSRNNTLAHEPARALIAHEFRTELLAVLDRYDESLAVTTETLAMAQRDRQGWAVRLWEGWHGRQLVQVGRLADAEAALEGVVETPGEVALIGVLQAVEVVALGRVAIHTANAARLRHCVTIARGLLDSGAPSVRRHAVWLLALEAMAAGDPSAARAHLCALGEQARHAVVPTYPMDVTDEVALVRIAVAAGDAELVQSALDSAATRALRNPGVTTIAGAAAHSRGLATGGLDDLLEAVSCFEKGPRPLALASALEDAGRAAVRVGRRDDGVAMLGSALEIYSRVGASWDARRVRGRLREFGVRRRIASAERPTHGWAALTQSELDVVRRVAQGMTNREVAEQLFLSIHTVSTHLRHAFTKLDINSRIELARLVALHDPAPR